MGEEYRSVVLENFPPVECCWFYGSTVVSQGREGDLLDMILVVKDVTKFHRENLQKNFDHYNFWKYIPQLLPLLTNLGPGVYFNTYASLEGVKGKVKYGIVAESKVLEDLETWKYMYLAGRAQKPFERIYFTNKEPMERAIESNRMACVEAVSKLQSTFVIDTSFLHNLCSLSYKGDIRTPFFEHPKKIQNIVEHQKEALERIYKPLAKRVQNPLYQGKNTVVSHKTAEMQEIIKKTVRISSLQQTVFFQFTQYIGNIPSSPPF